MLEDAPLPPHPRHEIAIVAGSILAARSGASNAEVSSFHHQAIDHLGRGLAVVALPADGVPEALELPGREVLAVQWELKRSGGSTRASSRVFDGSCSRHPRAGP